MSAHGQYEAEIASEKVNVQTLTFSIFSTKQVGEGGLPSPES